MLVNCTRLLHRPDLCCTISRHAQASEAGHHSHDNMDWTVRGFSPRIVIFSLVFCLSRLSRLVLLLFFFDAFSFFTVSSFASLFLLNKSQVLDQGHDCHLQLLWPPFRRQLRGCHCISESGDFPNHSCPWT